MSDDRQTLKLLSTLHYVMGGLSLATSLLALPHIGMGLFAIYAPESFDDGDPISSMIFGWLFLGMGALFMVGCIVIGIATLLSAGGLRRRRRYWLSFVVACIECLSMPIGTALGVFTIITLAKPSVKALYGLEVSDRR
ncbi:MAG: hypothetical protein O3C67_05360 [Cyanobacteria bacterium]|nr:hypothetical protein [Cyanobacteriota bacterium]